MTARSTASISPSIPRQPYKLSLDEYMELPNDGKRYQILDGVLDVAPVPAPRHQHIQNRLAHVLTAELEDLGRGEVYVAPIDWVLHENTIVQPDLIFIAAERLHIVGESNVRGALDLVVEIVSPSTRRTDVLIKSELYARFGVSTYWIVDPDLDRIEAYRLSNGRYEPAGAASSPAIFEPAAPAGLEIDLTEIFIRPLRPQP